MAKSRALMKWASREAFTLIELLVVIAIIAILAAVLLPVLRQAQVRGMTATCIDNQKQLATAWVMYANDNSDYTAGNAWTNEQNWTIYRGVFSPRSPITVPQNWISGWMDPSGQSPNNKASIPNGDSDNTNDTLLVDPSYASMGDYTKNRKLFICPACNVLVDSVQSGAKSYHEIRSVSMNCWVGYVCSPPSQPTYKTFNKLTSVTAGIDPADLFVFMEERGESIDDGSFETQEGNTTVANWPTDYHNGAATIGFADGHVDVHRWYTSVSSVSGWSFTTQQQVFVPTKWGGATEPSIKEQTDLSWLQQHATCLK